MNVVLLIATAYSAKKNGHCYYKLTKLGNWSFEGNMAQRLEFRSKNDTKFRQIVFFTGLQFFYIGLVCCSFFHTCSTLLLFQAIPSKQIKSWNVFTPLWILKQAGNWLSWDAWIFYKWEHGRHFLGDKNVCFVCLLLSDFKNENET